MFDTNLNNLLPGLTLLVGPQAYLARLSAERKTDVSAIALGVNGRYEIISSWGLAAIGSGFYSPGVLTFGSARNLYDFVAGAEVRLAPQLHVLAGYRWFKFTLIDQPDDKVANEVFAGVRYQIK
jgi:YfaZ precursor